MVNRPPCLYDVEPNGFTWPLRFCINACVIIVRNTHPKNIRIFRTKKPPKKITIKYRIFLLKRKIVFNNIKMLYIKLKMLFINFNMYYYGFQMKLCGRKFLCPLVQVLRLLHFLVVLPLIFISLLMNLLRLFFYEGPKQLFGLPIKLTLKTEFGRRLIMRWFHKRLFPYPPKIEIQQISSQYNIMQHSKISFSYDRNIAALFAF